MIRNYADSSDPDQRTSMADSRIALNIARGVAMEDIDPASGYDYSRDAYDRTRHSWVWNIKQHGYSSVYEGAALARAVANWTAHRPDFIAGDDWLAAVADAHHAYWAGIGRPCSRSTCDLHATEEEDPAMAAGIPSNHRSQLAGYLAIDGIRMADDPHDPAVHTIRHQGADWTATYWGHLAGEPIWHLVGPAHPYGIDLDVYGIHAAITKNDPTKGTT